MAAASSPSSSPRLTVKGRPALVQWTSEKQSSTSILSDLTFDLYYDPDRDTAFFKLRAKVTLKDSPSSVPTSVYLFIPPERIQTLTVVEPPEFSSYAQSHPNVDSLGPDASEESEIWTDLGFFAINPWERFLDVFAKLPTRLAPRASLRSLSSAASQAGSLTSTPEQIVTATLYAGEGGEVIEDNDTDETGKSGDDDELYTERLPSYDELTSTSHTRKRQRKNSVDSPNGRRLSDLEQVMHRIEQHLIHRVEQQEGELNRLGTVVVQQAEEIRRLTQKVECQEEEKASLLERIESLSERLDICEIQIEEEVDSKWDAARDDVLDSVRDELRQWISDRLQPFP